MNAIQPLARDESSQSRRPVVPLGEAKSATERTFANPSLAEFPVVVEPTDSPLEEEAKAAVEKPKKVKKKAKAKKRGKGKMKGAKSKAKGKVANALGSARGIETMFRSSYRTQLDLTALAATKANIMISLNGFILSVLTLSGPFVLVAEPLFTIPIAIFLTTCLASIIFAVLAARPRLRQKRFSQEDFDQDRANLLVFEDFSSLEREEHLESTMKLLQNNTRIYRNMTRQIYFLGTMANCKFRMLSVSYAAFLGGLTISTLALLAIGFFHHTPDLSGLLGQIQLGRLGRFG